MPRRRVKREKVDTYIERILNMLDNGFVYARGHEVRNKHGRNVNVAFTNDELAAMKPFHTEGSDLEIFASRSDLIREGVNLVISAFHDIAQDGGTPETAYVKVLRKKQSAQSRARIISALSKELDDIDTQLRKSALTMVERRLLVDQLREYINDSALDDYLDLKDRAAELHSQHGGW